MSFSEFDIIRRFFTEQSVRRDDVSLGVGDDCALLRARPEHELAVTIDTMVEGVHFPPETDPEALGHKVLAVSLSDLAAMGAEPAWATLSLSVPEPEEWWLEGFARGLFTLATQHGVQLVGGDTVRGPLVVTTQLHGFVPEGRALRRAGAAVGDLVYVTGTLGDAGAGLRLALGEWASEERGADFLRRRLERPAPRVREGMALRGIATAAMDLSDGLIADLERICAASGVGAELWVDHLPLSEALESVVPIEEALSLAVGAGDDYELCFTVPETRAEEVEAICRRFDCGCRPVGRIEAARGLRLTRDGKPYLPSTAGFDHFTDR